MSSSVNANTPLTPPLSNEEQAIAARLRKHVDILADLIGPRLMEKPTSMEAAATYIRHTFAEAGHQVESHAYQVSGKPAENLFVEIRGISRPDEIIVVGAHYDTISTTPGADDNASAVAALLEIARAFAGAAHARTVRFVAFANEEPPHFYTDDMGSQAYARLCRQRNENIVGMVCLEMIGYYDTRRGSQSYPPGLPKWLTRLLPQRGDFIAFVSNFRSTRLLLTARRGFRGSVRFPLVAFPLPERIFEIHLSDHSSFWAHGYPALMVTDTSFFRNQHYHLPSDTPDTLDYPRLARVTTGLTNTIQHLASHR